MTRTTRLLLLLGMVIGEVVLAQPASAAVTVTRAELAGSTLRIEGTAAASRDISLDGLVLGRSDGSGEFEIRRDSYTAPHDCTVDLADGSPTVTQARLSGCTVSQPPPPADTSAPTAPTGLTASLSGSTASLGWTASVDDVGVVGYRVSRNGVVLPGTATSTGHLDPDLGAGTYSYTVSAVDAAGNVSSASGSASVTVAAAEQPPPDTTPPSVPADFVVVMRGYDNTELTWSPSTDDTAVAGYRIRRNDTVLTGTYLNPSYGDTRLAAGTYTYAVAAVDTSGNLSAWTPSVSVVVQPAPETDTTAPTVPTSPSATVVGTTVSLGWGMSYDDTLVTGYRITRNGAVLTTTDSASFVDSGLAAGTYTYTVAAFDAAGNVSAESAGVSAVVAPAEGLTFLTPAQLPDADVGQAYLAHIVASDPPGPSTFTFRLVSGRVPDGTRFSGNTLENRPEARVSGTPSRTGTFSFTVEVKDGTGATARRSFTVRVL